MEDVLVVKGTVTNINQKLHSFEIESVQDARARISKLHVVVLLLEQSLRKFPAKNTSVTIKSSLFKTDDFGRSVLVLTSPEDVLEGEFTLVPETNDFPDVVNHLNLTPLDLLSVAINYNTLNKGFKPQCTTIEDTLLCILKTLGHTNFQLQLLNRLKHIDDEKESYKDYSYWTFGTHWNWCESSNHYLVGYFCIDKSTVSFTDGTHRILCVFVNKSNEILKFLDSCVLIKDYIYITEIYNNAKYFAIEYLLVDVNKVVNLSLRRSTAGSTSGAQKLSCEIVAKSQPVAVPLKEVVCWLQLKTTGNSSRFFRVKAPPENICQVLQAGQFTVFFQQPPQKLWNVEVEKLCKMGHPQKSVALLELGPNTRFVHSGPSTQPSEILNVTEAFNRLTTSFGLVSFEGVILMKIFMNPMSSWTTPVMKDPRFGTPGIKTHKLIFDAGGKNLEVYLNNWENLAAPFGLIPKMRVIVRFVLAQKGRYYKSTTLTSIEVVNYEPEVRFETANLYDRDWGVSFYLGAGKFIPTSTIIWGRILSFSISGLKFMKNKSNQMEGHITLIALDNIGESKIIAKNETALLLLRLMLRLPKPVFSRWMKSFISLGQFNIADKVLGGKPGKEATAERILHEFFQNLKKKGCRLSLFCRKMDNEPSGRPVYFMLDGRF